MMRTLLILAALLLVASAAIAAPRIWLEHTDVPVAVMASNDTGAAQPGCLAEWTLRFADGSHYTEVAVVDLPATGEAKAVDCREWWDERRSKTLDVSLVLYDRAGAVLARQEYEGVFKAVARQGIPTDGWSATASRGPNVKAAFDGDLGSRWDTGRVQQAGDWYQLDMGQGHRIAGLIVDTRGSANDYPSGLTVSVSEDGQQWTTVAEIADTEPLNQAGRLTLRFDPVTARHLKLTLTKPHGTNWFWSIHELSVLPAEGV